jgi:hypothetical protein
MRIRAGNGQGHPPGRAGAGLVRLAGAFAAFALLACDSSSLSQGPPVFCTEAGALCKLPEGPLGVCERSACPAGASSPCFRCTPQH